MWQPLTGGVRGHVLLLFAVRGGGYPGRERRCYRQPAPQLPRLPGAGTGKVYIRLSLPSFMPPPLFPLYTLPSRHHRDTRADLGWVQAYMHRAHADFHSHSIWFALICTISLHRSTTC